MSTCSRNTISANSKLKLIRNIYYPTNSNYILTPIPISISQIPHPLSTQCHNTINITPNNKTIAINRILFKNKQSLLHSPNPNISKSMLKLISICLIMLLAMCLKVFSKPGPIHSYPISSKHSNSYTIDR